MTDILMRTVRDGPTHKASVKIDGGTPPEGTSPISPASLTLHVNATDFQRGILRVHEVIKVGHRAAGSPTLTVLYPEWLPGYHAPNAPLELLAGLHFYSQGQELEWRRDPFAVHAFHVELPEGAEELEAEFQMLCAIAEDQGRVGFTSRHLNLQWNTVVLYPAGYKNQQIMVASSIELPPDWKFACALKVEEQAEKRVSFAAAPLDRLVDSPLFAGLHYRKYPIEQQVTLNVFGDEPHQTEVGEKPLNGVSALVAEADAIFGARPFAHYDFLIATSDELGSLGVEHHQSTEIVMPSDFFSDWEGTASRNAVVAHEFVHAWNGKFRRGRGSCTSSFDIPIENSLMWVYEGLTQYWGEILATRSGLWSKDRYIGLLAQAAGKSALVKGRTWRPMRDTTCDPIIASRDPLPWLSWQRSEDYYSDGKLMWLDVDTLIRERTEGEQSLDDFGRDFFGTCCGEVETSPYDMEDVVRALDGICPYDWQGFFENHLSGRSEKPPFDGIARGGYELAFKEEPNDFHRDADKSLGMLDFSHSLGLSLDSKGKVKEVIWESPAFHAGLTAGVDIAAVNGWGFSQSAIETAIKDSREAGMVTVIVKKLKRCETLEILYSGGPRYPHLITDLGNPRLDDILKSRRDGSSAKPTLPKKVPDRAPCRR